MVKVFYFLLLLGEALCLYEYADVVHLTPTNFDRLVTNSPDTWVVQFFSPYCPYCQEFAPEFEKAATALKNKVKVGVVDSDEDKELLRRFNVHSIPTVKIYDTNKQKPEDYTGPRTGDALIKRISQVTKHDKRKTTARKDIFASDSPDQDLNIKK